VRENEPVRRPLLSIMSRKVTLWGGHGDTWPCGNPAMSEPLLATAKWKGGP